MDNNNNLEEKPISIDETIKTETPTPKPDATALLLSKLEDMEKRLQEAQQPKPKPKRQPSEKQLENLKKAREKKLEMDAKKKEVKKQLKAEQKKIIKEKIKEQDDIPKDIPDTVANVEISNNEPERPKTPEPVNMEIKEPEPPLVRSNPIPIPQRTPTNPLDNYRIAQRRRGRR